MALQRHEFKNSISTLFQIDEYKAKMGDDDSIIVLSLVVKFKTQADDLMSFVEKGYDWVLDADVSTGELDSGEYIIFIELERKPSAPEKIIKLFTDFENITDTPINDYKFTYKGEKEMHPLTAQMLSSVIPLSPKLYREKYGNNNIDMKIESMQNIAGIKTSKKVIIKDAELANFINLSKR